MLDITTEKGMLVKMLGENRRLSEEEISEYVRALVIGKLTDKSRFREKLLKFYFCQMGADYSFDTVTKHVNEKLIECKKIDSLTDQLQSIKEIVRIYFNNILGITDKKLVVPTRELQNDILELISKVHGYIKNNTKLYDTLDLEIDLNLENNMVTLIDDYEGTEELEYQASTQLVAWLLGNMRLKEDQRHDLFKMLTSCIDYNWSLCSVKVEDVITFYKLEE